MQNMIDVTCSVCNHVFQKRLGEYNRANRKGWEHCCSKKCQSQKANSKHTNRQTQQLRPNNRLDEYSPFRYFFFNMKASSKTASRKKVEVTVEDLKKLWEDQKGVCPLTGWHLSLPKSALGWDEGIDIKRKASVDRIDNSRGYSRDNIRFVSLMGNLARNKFSEEDLIEFSLAVGEYRGGKMQIRNRHLPVQTKRGAGIIVVQVNEAIKSPQFGDMFDSHGSSQIASMTGCRSVRFLTQDHYNGRSTVEIIWDDGDTECCQLPKVERRLEILETFKPQDGQTWGMDGIEEYRPELKQGTVIVASEYGISKPMYHYTEVGKKSSAIKHEHFIDPESEGTKFRVL